MDPLSQRLKDLNGGRILDVATGTGEFLKLLGRSFESFTEGVGIDPTGARIEAAAKEADERLKFEVMDGEKLSFEDASFDTVAIRHSLHHLEHIDKVLAEMVRVLKPGGLMIVGEVIQDPVTERPNSQRHIHHWWGKVDQTKGVPHFETFTREQVQAIVEPLALRDPEVFEYFEECSAEEKEEALKNMVEHTEEVVLELTKAGNHPELAAEGEKLVALFRKQGYADEKTLVVMGRKPD